MFKHWIVLGRRVPVTLELAPVRVSADAKFPRWYEGQKLDRWVFFITSHYSVDPLTLQELAAAVPACTPGRA